MKKILMNMTSTKRKVKLLSMILEFQNVQSVCLIRQCLKFLTKLKKTSSMKTRKTMLVYTKNCNSK